MMVCPLQAFELNFDNTKIEVSNSYSIVLVKTTKGYLLLALMLHTAQLLQQLWWNRKPLLKTTGGLYVCMPRLALLIYQKKTTVR